MMWGGDDSGTIMAKVAHWRLVVIDIRFYNIAKKIWIIGGLPKACGFSWITLKRWVLT